MSRIHCALEVQFQVRADHQLDFDMRKSSASVYKVHRADVLHHRTISLTKPLPCRRKMVIIQNGKYARILSSTFCAIHLCIKFL